MGFFQQTQNNIPNSAETPAKAKANYRSLVNKGIILALYLHKSAVIMKKVYLEYEFDDKHLKCPKCGWEGNGSEANIFDLYGVTKLKEAHCPKCDEYLAGLSREKSSGDAGDDAGIQIS